MSDKPAENETARESSGADTRESSADERIPSKEKAEAVKETLIKVGTKVGRTLSDWGSKIAEKSVELYEQGKLEIKINSLDRDISTRKRDLGEKLYNLWSQGRVEDRIVNDLLGEILNDLSDVIEEREVHREILTNLTAKKEN